MFAEDCGDAILAWGDLSDASALECAQLPDDFGTDSIIVTDGLHDHARIESGRTFIPHKELGLWFSSCRFWDYAGDKTLADNSQSEQRFLIDLVAIVH